MLPAIGVWGHVRENGKKRYGLPVKFTPTPEGSYRIRKMPWNIAFDCVRLIDTSEGGFRMQSTRNGAVSGFCTWETDLDLPC